MDLGSTAKIELLEFFAKVLQLLKLGRSLPKVISSSHVMSSPTRKVHVHD